MMRKLTNNGEEVLRTVWVGATGWFYHDLIDMPDTPGQSHL